MTGCSRMSEVQELLRLGHWPHAARVELAAHVRACRKCGEMVLLTQAFTASKTIAVRDARVEPPALVWWRAQLRRKHESVQRVERPMRAQMLVVLAVVCVGLGLVFRLSGGVASWRAWMSSGMSSGTEAVARAGVSGSGMALVVLSAVVLAMMAGLAVYLTLDRK